MVRITVSELYSALIEEIGRLFPGIEIHQTDFGCVIFRECHQIKLIVDEAEAEQGVYLIVVVKCLNLPGKPCGGEGDMPRLFIDLTDPHSLQQLETLIKQSR